MARVVWAARVGLAATAAFWALSVSAASHPEPSDPAPDLSATTVVQHLYWEHELLRASGVSLFQMPLLAQAYLLDDLAEQLAEDRTPFDLLYNAPSHVVEAPTIQVESDEGGADGRRRVVARVTHGGERAIRLTFVLEREQGQWQIGEIIAPDWRLTEILGRDQAMMAPR